MKYLLALLMLVEFSTKENTWLWISSVVITIHNWKSAVRRAEQYIRTRKAKRAAAQAYREADKMQPFIEKACERPMKQELLCCEAGPTLWSWGLATELLPGDPIVLKMEEEEKNSPAYRYAQHLRAQEDAAISKKAEQSGYESGWCNASYVLSPQIEELKKKVAVLEKQLKKARKSKKS